MKTRIENRSREHVATGVDTACGATYQLALLERASQLSETLPRFTKLLNYATDSLGP
jgi:hypothetical protein